MRRCRYHHRLRIEQHFHTGFCPERRQRNDWRLDHRRERSVNAPDTRTRFFDDRISVPRPRHFEQSLSATFFRPNSHSTKRQLARRPFMRGFSVRCGKPDRSYWLGPLPAQSGTIHISPWLCPRVGDFNQIAGWSLYRNCKWCCWRNGSRAGRGVRVGLVVFCKWFEE
jgi:hypothetical protein